MLLFICLYKIIPRTQVYMSAYIRILFFACLQMGKDKPLLPDHNCRAITDVAKTGNIIAGNAAGIVIIEIPVGMTENAMVIMVRCHCATGSAHTITGRWLCEHSKQLLCQVKFTL